mgnify:CR=1 FL=1
MQEKKPQHKPIVCVNTDSGEIVANWSVQWKGPVHNTDHVRMRVNAQGTKFDHLNVGVYEPQDIPKAIQTDHPEFGEIAYFNDKRKFTKTFQLHEPTFTKQIMRAYWFRIERNVEQDTGIIIRRNAHHEVNRVETITQWQCLIEASKTSTYRFIKECETNGYLARFLFSHAEHKHQWWIVNPTYHWNGNAIPLSIWELFNERNFLCTGTLKNPLKATPRKASSDSERRNPS